MMELKRVVLTLLIGLFVLAPPAVGGEYELLFHQDQEGNVVDGDLMSLRNAIRAGRRIRIYMNIGEIEHAMDGGFLTIFNGKVYAQIATIHAQRPNRKSGEIELLQLSKHVGLYSTDSPYEMKWFGY